MDRSGGQGAGQVRRPDRRGGDGQADLDHLRRPDDRPAVRPWRAGAGGGHPPGRLADPPTRAPAAIVRRWRSWRRAPRPCCSTCATRTTSTPRPGDAARRRARSTSPRWRCSPATTGRSRPAPSSGVLTASSRRAVMLGADPLGSHLAGTIADVAGDLGASRSARRRANPPASASSPSTAPASTTPARPRPSSSAPRSPPGIAYLRALDRRGVALATAFARIELRLPPPPTSSPRSPVPRRPPLWGRVAEVLGAPDAAGITAVHAVTSRAMMTAYDPWVNMLRVDRRLLRRRHRRRRRRHRAAPRPLLDASPTELGRRVGRNTQSILRAGVAPRRRRSTRPAARGTSRRSPTSWPTPAWAWFQEIEAAGGFVAAVDNGSLAGRIAATWAAGEREHRHPQGAAHRRHRVPEHRRAGAGDPAEPTAPTGLPRAPLARALRGPARRRRRRPRPATARRCSSRRSARPALSTRADHVRQELLRGRRPAHDRPGRSPTTRRRSPPRSRASGATVACLCSSDPVYAEHGVAVAEALRRPAPSGSTSPAGPATCMDDARPPPASAHDPRRLRRPRHARRARPRPPESRP